MTRKSVYKSKLTGSEKVKTVVYIPRQLFERVSSLAVQVYGVQRGALSLAVAEALEMWLAARAAAHTKQHTNPRLPIRERFNTVLKCLEDLEGVIPITVHQVFLEKCIMESFNVKDMRSVYGWLHRFYLSGLIKPLTVLVSRPRDWARNKAVELVARRA